MFVLDGKKHFYDDKNSGKMREFLYVNRIVHIVIVLLIIYCVSDLVGGPLKIEAICLLNQCDKSK